MSARRFGLPVGAIAGAAVVLALAVSVGLGLGPASAVQAGSAQAGVSPSCVPPALNPSEALAGGKLTVSPGPATRDASPTTQISLLGAPAGDLTNVTVNGSHSGPHPGRLAAYSQGDGASFLPTHPFSAGELVRVSGDLTSGGQSTPFSWSFTVAIPDHPPASSTHANISSVGGASSSGSAAIPTPAPSEYQSFRSAPELRPPTLTVSSTENTATGEMLLAPYSGIGQYGPMIVGEHGELIWFDRIPTGARAADLRVQRYEGKPVLTWWQDPLVANGSSAAGLVIANSSYQTVADVRAGNGYQPDLHEFAITPQGTAIVTVYDAIDCNLSAVGGPSDGAVADTLLQEIDLKTGLVEYEWHSLDHVALSNSYSSAAPTNRADPFDYFHINSVDVQKDGDLLVDSRNTWAAYDVNALTGQVRWELGGKHSSFKLGAGASTAWQHDARQQPNGNYTFFDNGAFPLIHDSRAIEVTLNPATMTDTLVRSYGHHNPLVAGSQGNVQALENGDWMIGWGQAGYLSEVAPSGQVLFNAHLPPSWESYRTYQQSWSGQPAQPPALALSGTTAYISWNGATEVASWRLLGGSSPTGLAPIATAAKSGFETDIPLPTATAYVQAQALNGAGAVIGASAVVKG